MSMVSNLTYNKKGYEKHNQIISKIGIAAQRLKKDLLILVDKDTQAFDAIMNAFRMPKKTDKEKEHRLKSIENATKNAIESPISIMKKCSELLESINGLLKYGNKNSFSEREWSELYKMSENTFVEESEESKQKAAGAGLTDND